MLVFSRRSLFLPLRVPLFSLKKLLHIVSRPAEQLRQSEASICKFEYTHLNGLRTVGHSRQKAFTASTLRTFASQTPECNFLLASSTTAAAF
jgi:hypothetical protein